MRVGQPPPRGRPQGSHTTPLCSRPYNDYEKLIDKGESMRDILPDVERWRERGERVAVATVVTMYGSAPRRPGAKLAVSESGELSGSVSGGCVEPAVVHSAMEVIETGEPQMLEFGISEEENFEKIGLSCGGTIHVFVERLDW